MGSLLSGASNGEYDTEDLLLAQLQAQTQHGPVATVQVQVSTGHIPETSGEDGAEMDDDERAASEYLNDGQLYLEKSKRQVQVQLLHGHPHQQQQANQQQQIVIASSAAQADPKCEEQARIIITTITT